MQSGYRRRRRKRANYIAIGIGTLLVLFIAIVTFVYFALRSPLSDQEAGNGVSTLATSPTIVIDSSIPVQDETSSDTVVEEETTDKNVSPPVIPTLALDTEEMSTAIEDFPASPTGCDTIIYAIIFHGRCNYTLAQ